MDRTARPWTVAEGAVTVYRLFEIGDEVDLERAERLASAPRSRVRLEKPGGPAALEIARPPLHVGLGQRVLPLVAGPRTAEASAHLFEFGVASVVYTWPIPAGTPLAALVPLAEELVARPTPALDAVAREAVEELCRSFGAAIAKARRWEGLETYTVFSVRRFEAPASAAEVLAQAPLAELLLGEPSATALSPGQREDVLRSAFSYLSDDLVVVDWNSAFVLEPSGVDDAADLLELATALLLELRSYDALLDRELDTIYDEIERRGARPSVFTPRYSRLQGRTAALLLDLSETVERIENAVKIVGDLYLARVYQAAVKRFRLGSWQESVLRKQRVLAGVNEILKGSADTRRAELLEITVILLILWEVVAALVRNGG